VDRFESAGAQCEFDGSAGRALHGRETEISFASLLSEFPNEMTGGQGFDVLVKALDSAVRLPAQTHPTRSFRGAIFTVSTGRRNAGSILATRPGAKLYFGSRKA